VSTHRAERYEFCEAYVDAADADVVREFLSGELGADVDRQTLSVPGVSLDVRTNPQVDAQFADDFVYWRVLIEAESDDPAERRPMLAVMTRVVTSLWEAGHRVVAACDFEDELPWQGGIARARSEGYHDPEDERA
jgi:hypothetical protein